MKKAILILATVINFSTIASAQTQKPDIKAVANKAALTTDKEFGIKAPLSKQIGKAEGDTLEILKDAKFIKINNMLIPTEAFSKSVPVFLSADAWSAVLEIINSRDYGKLPATTINEIIESIFIQVKQKGKQ